MFCDKCGGIVDENTKICQRCGATSNNIQKTDSENGKGFIRWLLKYGNLIVNTAALIIVFCGIIVMVFRANYLYEQLNSFGKFIWSVARNLPKYLSIACIAFMGIKVYHYQKTKKQIEHECPKCRKLTEHNNYGVCSKCNYDGGANSSFKLACYIFTYILFIIRSTSFINALFGEISGFYVYSLVDIMVMIFMLCVLIEPIMFYPAKLARRTNHSAAKAIYWLNLIFGGNLIIWLILMIWASSGKGIQKSQTVVIHQQEPQIPQKSTQETFEELTKLKEMGMISEEEFEQKRKELLSRI